MASKEKNDVTENIDEDLINRKEEAKVAHEENEKSDPVVDETTKEEENLKEVMEKQLRLMAEFENFRKRSEKEKSEMFDNGVSSLALKILPVVDNFERGLEAAKVDGEDNAYYQGFNKIYVQLIEVLEAAGIKPIGAVDKEFDPNFHNAVLHEENEDYGDNIIIEEFQKGYTYKDKVIRYSMVRVAN